MAILDESMPTVLGRSCGDCTKCCDGALSAVIKIQSRDTVHNLGPGSPCVFVQLGKGCTVYDERPHDPCKKFRCQYLLDEFVPEEMKPNKSNVILIVDEIEGMQYYRAVEADGTKMQAEYLVWIMGVYLNHGVNVMFTIEGRPYYFGSNDFTKVVNKVTTTHSLL
jgi:hypothetical protein